MKILGIETSCDETAAAVVENGTKVLSNVIASSVDMHSQTGGVVPEVAAREHIIQISPVIDKAMLDAGTEWSDIDAIAVTYAPGLIASLLIGVNTAQTLAYIHKKPLIPVHHVSGHIYANWLDRGGDDLDLQSSVFEFPILVLTISGGHNELVLMKGHHDFEVIGETLDDAAGEAFDKVARLLNLGFPGGPVISKRAESGDPSAYDFPRPMLDKDNKYNFSFSGLKSAVRREVDECEMGNTKSEIIDDISASFQSAVIDVLADKLVMAADEFGVKAVHLAGGVSANQLLRKTVRERLSDNIELFWPEKMIYCTDNAAMVASSGYFQYQKKGAQLEKIEPSSQKPLT
ncbi:tRNA (adenosine(37)-N6)-threonylcarbamoyltransferase complex transferase subunit TsaD [Candidatus Peregrinibacteria bacterium]|nr:tRNA (adenosine(37)-N6)-threonylcarbamoyltransferase complex transferase subunit TsaD [Candidatus Peregrinibacteria bacterium]